MVIPVLILPSEVWKQSHTMSEPKRGSLSSLQSKDQRGWRDAQIHILAVVKDATNSISLSTAP
jgi:hypothetical protein